MRLMPLFQKAQKTYPQPEIGGNAIRACQSNCDNSTCNDSSIVLHILDVGGNSHGTFEFDRAVTVSQVKEKLSLPEDRRADLLFEDDILYDTLTLDDYGVLTGATLTVVIMTKTLLETVMTILEAQRMKASMAESNNTNIEENGDLHADKYCNPIVYKLCKSWERRRYALHG